jgi:hypothetical protein
MNWRPKGWENPYKEGVQIAWDREIDLSQETQQACFEVGADAMLEALKKQAIPHEVYADYLRYGFDRGAKIFTGEEDKVTYQGVKGTLVFIPDAEGK